MKRQDGIARWVIQICGLFAIFCMIAIVMIIAATAFPLLAEPQAHQAGVYTYDGAPAAEDVLAVGLDDFRETGFCLSRGGRLDFFEIQAADNGSGGPLKLRETIQLVPEDGSIATILRLDRVDSQRFGLLWQTGEVSFLEILLRPEFDAEGNRRIEHSFSLTQIAESVLNGAHPRQFCFSSDDGVVTIALLYEHHLEVLRQVTITSLFGDEEAETYSSRSEKDVYQRVRAMEMDGAGRTVYLGTEDGLLVRAVLDEEGQIDDSRINNALLDTDAPAAVSALGLVYGDVSLAVGEQSGALSTWFMVRHGEQENLQRIHPLRTHTSGPVKIRPTARNKCVLSLSADGVLHFDHMTSERALLQIATDSPIREFGYNLPGDGLLTYTDDRKLTLWHIEMDHPEVGWKTLFGKVWYEGHEKPEYIWQSSSGNDDFEPKLSVIPLMFGTFKGTFYAMIFATPLALLSAIYTSQFAHPRIRSVIKPTMEIMAGVPSVVIGFIIALWLAPILAKWVVPFGVSFITIPLVCVAFLWGWQKLEAGKPQKFGQGLEFLLLIPAVFIGGGLALPLGNLVEKVLFDGDFPLWLYQTWEMQFDQRNSVIIAFGLGFAVIPIIFTIAEDALSSVPPSLSAASLALGASRWQTASRIVLLSASPGIFAGVIIGFARAVGETMIVLMATGNTPILDWSPFNGMRTLSANIAVEIPEAPVGGSLYRVLFLCAIILFLMTFVLNTGAELVRERLRRKYGRFQ